MVDEKKERYRRIAASLSLKPGTRAKSRLDIVAGFYNAFIGATTGIARTYRATSPPVRALLQRVVDNCLALGVDEKTYFDIMFRQPAEVSVNWGPYPPLNWLGSKRAAEVFGYRLDEIKRRIQGTDVSLAEYLETISFLNLEQHFVAGFRDGAPLVARFRVQALTEQGVWGPGDLFAVFSAYPDVFSPLFVATHPKLREFLFGAYSVHLIDDLTAEELKREVRVTVSELLEQLKNLKYKERVLITRALTKKNVRESMIELDSRLADECEESWEWL